MFKRMQRIVEYNNNRFSIQTKHNFFSPWVEGSRRYSSLEGAIKELKNEEVKRVIKSNKIKRKEHKDT